jgi:MFS family permease
MALASGPGTSTRPTGIRAARAPRRRGDGPRYRRAVRRLLTLCAAVVLVDTMLYAALTPLLPELADEYGLSKGGSGLLVAAFAIGALAAALPSGMAVARLGPRAAVLGGLAFTSIALVGFAFAGDAWTLGLSRLVQGAASTLSWAGASTWLVAAAPRDRRGQVLGTAISAAVVGALLGPVVGAVASEVGIRSTFLGVSVAGAILFAWTLASPGAAADPQPLSALWPVLRNRSFLQGLWLMLLPALLFGVLAVLLPLDLAAAGWGAAAIGAVFLVGAGAEAVMHPLIGRYSDRRGRLAPMRIALVASVFVSVALAWAGPAAVMAVVAFFAFLAYGSFFAPASAHVSDAAEDAGLTQGLAFGVVNGAWAVGNSVGPSVGGALADVSGDALPFLLCAAICAATLPLLLRPGTRLGRVPEIS